MTTLTELGETYYRVFQRAGRPHVASSNSQFPPVSEWADSMDLNGCVEGPVTHIHDFEIEE